MTISLLWRGQFVAESEADLDREGLRRYQAARRIVRRRFRSVRRQLGW